MFFRFAPDGPVSVSNVLFSTRTHLGCDTIVFKVLVAPSISYTCSLWRTDMDDLKSHLSCSVILCWASSDKASSIILMPFIWRGWGDIPTFDTPIWCSDDEITYMCDRICAIMCSYIKLYCSVISHKNSHVVEYLHIHSTWWQDTLIDNSYIREPLHCLHC